MAIKSVNAAIGGVGAGVTSARIVLPTPDDAGNREVIAIKSSLTTKGMTFTFDTNGAPQIVVDAAILSQFTTDLPIDYVVPPNIQIGFTLQNTTGGALAAGDFVTVFYKV